jgi:hypothetical protein
MNEDQVSGGWDDGFDRIGAPGRRASPEPEEFEDDPVPDEEDEE